MKEDWEIVNYDPSMQKEWDAFVDASRNGTFLLKRGYMDYHSDRFRDHSLMARRKGKLMALLPADATDDGILHSHRGLTYGGWIMPSGHLDGEDLLELFEAAIEKLREEGFHELDYKAIPSIYSEGGAEDDRYVLFRLGAQLAGCGLSMAIQRNQVRGFNTMQRRHLKKALSTGAEIRENRGGSLQKFMHLLEECLAARHGVRPVHTEAELTLLRSRFPENIVVFEVYMPGADAPDAGVCVYDTGRVAHIQYIATTERGRDENLLSLLFDYLINRRYSDREWVDFGISTEDNGHVLNNGLLRQKSSYGGGGIIYPRYRFTF